MSGSVQFAVDTSSVIALIKGSIRSDRALTEVAFPFAVVGELRFGALGGSNPQRKLAEIDDVIRRGSILVADSETMFDLCTVATSLENRRYSCA